MSETVVVINGETLGRGDEKLGAKIMLSFLKTLGEVEPRPGAIIFYNSAVRLLAPESPALAALKTLDDAGVDLLACVTCLEFYELTQRLAVGAVSNMREIVQRELRAAKVITI